MKDATGSLSQSSYLKKGNVVLILPSGGAGITKNWKKGIGEIILKCSEYNIQYTLYQCMISKLSEYILLWHFISAKIYLRNHPIKIHGEKIVNSSIKKNMNAREITALLQKDFYKKSW